MACYQWVLKSEKTERGQMRDSSFRYLNKLAGISISLSAEDDLMTLLRKILEEGRNIACCDAASLFLINEVTEQSRELVFKLIQNDSMDFPFEEMRFSLDDSSIAGQATHSVNLYHAKEDPQNPRGGRHNGRKFTGLAYNLLYRLSAQHTPYVRASIQDVEHDSEHPVFFNTIRSDDNETVTAGWLWTVARNLVVTGEASYTDNKSDIELFDYSRFRYQLGFRYQF